MAMEMTVGKRIVLGFTITIVIALVLGGVGVWSMLGAKTDSEKLALEYIPEVKIATDLRGAGNRLMFEMRGYGMTEDEKYLKKAKSEIDFVNQHIAEANALADEAKYLKELKGQTEKAAAAMDSYQNLITQTEEVIAAMNLQRKALDENAESYMRNCEEFLAGQNQAFKKDLSERQEKLKIATAISDASTAVRVGNFKAQASNDPEMMQQAIAKLDDVKLYAEKIRPITRAQSNIDQINNIEAGAEAYGQAMQTCLQYLGSATGSGSQQMQQAKQQMDDAASKLVNNCKAFLDSQQNALEREMTERHEKINLVNDIIVLGNDSRVKAFKSQALRDPEIMQSAISNFPKLEQKYTELRKITRLQEDLQRIDNTQRSGENYSKALSAFLGKWKTLQDLGSKREQAGQSLIDACKVTADAGMDSTIDIANNAVSTMATNSSIMSIGLITGTVIALIAAIWIIRSITGPLSRIIETLQGGSANVAVAAGEVSSSSQSLAQGASEQAASIEETNSSVEEMASMIKNSAGSATEASTLSNEAANTAAAGTEAMTRMSMAIDEIKASADETAKIVKTIDEIAFQTNLLALNAAVEAARAGEAGKGFAVVAEEVRNLAQRSAEAARNTAKMIEGSVHNADNGVIISKEVEKFLTEIAGGAQKVNDLVSDIAAANREQANGIDHISQAISQMDQVTQSNAADAEESAAASEELSAQASQVDAVVIDLQRLVAGSNMAARVDMNSLKQKSAGQIRSNIEKRITGKMPSGFASSPAMSSKPIAMHSSPAASQSHDEIPMDSDELELIEF